MKTWVRKTLSVGVLAAGALLFAPGAAQADVSQDSSQNVGILNGTQVFAPIAVPLNVVGNSIGVAGEANSAGQGINWVESGQQNKGNKGNKGDRRHRGGKNVSQNSYGNFGVLNGTQAYLPVSVPVNVVGNSAAILGLANASGAGVNHVESGKVTERRRGADQDTSGNYGVLNGAQVYAPIDVPINLCGNALSILGLAQSQAACVNGGGHRTESVSQDSSSNYGIANGTQVYAPISAPLNIAGNSIGVAGEANSAAVAKNESGKPGGFSQDSSRNVGILNGTQLAAPISIPVNVCGNSLAVLGLANSAAACGNDVDGDGGNKGNGGHGGHNNGGHGGHNNGGDNGDGDYAGDGDDKGYGDDNDVDGDGGNKGDGYGDGNAADNGDKYGDAPRKAHGKKATTEAAGIDGLTQNLSNAGGLNVGGLNVMDTLTK
ncbi:chaplin family protein [Actinoplanes friuliensis]|uniref:Chaplin domain-containing protein n=1 Tax=Actinoplanes friuliensis DSM 7358 TaxID=1246995 RepID=U5VRP2_9ACTN|nr:chaplin family protein [Actinoplanes friuliensis]AGZ38326.1 hypothetical protein AFR_00185 [Actinoplanes friuliensis DSM 7358]